MKLCSSVYVNQWILHPVFVLQTVQRSIILCKLIDRSENEGYLSSCNGNGHGYSMAASDSHHMANHSSFDNGETSWSMIPENQVTYNGIPQQVKKKEANMRKSSVIKKLMLSCSSVIFLTGRSWTSAISGIIPWLDWAELHIR